jgi:uncharacterized protein (TIGR02594 family)
MNLSKQYQFLAQEPAPKMLLEALKLVGTKEIPGVGNSPVIMKWAKEVGLEKIYVADETPWCGLAMALIAKRAGKIVPFKNYDNLRALKWAEFGTPVVDAKLGDVLIFQRPGGGHVGLYVGEDVTTYHVLGGNQSNAFGFTRIAKKRCVAISRPIYSQGTPANVRKILLDCSGEISKNEA